MEYTKTLMFPRVEDVPAGCTATAMAVVLAEDLGDAGMRMLAWAEDHGFRVRVASEGDAKLGRIAGLSLGGQGAKKAGDKVWMLLSGQLLKAVTTPDQSGPPPSTQG